jgi:hypothetical protein
VKIDSELLGATIILALSDEAVNGVTVDYPEHAVYSPDEIMKLGLAEGNEELLRHCYMVKKGFKATVVSVTGPIIGR